MLRLASESYVRRTIVAQMESLVAPMANALRLALERRAMLPHIVQRVKLVVIALKVQVNVLLLALENRVNMNHTAQLMNIVVIMLIYANVHCKFQGVKITPVKGKNYSFERSNWFWGRNYPRMRSS